jgi:hypothetical protein
LRLAGLAIAAVLFASSANAQQFDPSVTRDAVAAVNGPQTRQQDRPYPQYQYQQRMANGQTRYVSPTYQGLDPNVQDLSQMAQIVGSAVNSRCVTQLCANVSNRIKAGELGRGAVNRGAPVNQEACIKANRDFGIEMSRLGHNITVREGTAPGMISYERASQVRGLMFTETYLIHASLRDIVSMGDAKACNDLKVAGIEVMHEIIRSRL